MMGPVSLAILLLTANLLFVSGVDEIKQNAFNKIASPICNDCDLNIHTVTDVSTLLGLPIDQSISDVGVFLRNHGICILEKRATFINFDQENLIELNAVLNVLNGATSFSNFIERAGFLRAYLNPGLYNYALRSIVLQNSHGFFDQIYAPELFNLNARSFFTDEAILNAIQYAHEEKRISNDIKVFSTGTVVDPEQRVAWFREDVGLNAFHDTIDLEPMSYQYVYAGQFINARYNVERIGAGLSRVKALSLDDTQITIEEGYDPHLSSYFGQRPAARPAGMILQDDTRTPDNERTISKLKYIRRKLIDAIRTGVFIDEEGNDVPVTFENLGNTAKGPPARSINPKLYGSETFAMLGHLLLSAITDPRGQYNQERGVVGSKPTALRDPLSYRWHATVNEIFTEYKQRLPSYSEGELQAPIMVNAFKIQMDEAGSQLNVLETFMEKQTIDIGIDPSIAREVGEGKGPVEVGIERLNHKPFHYHINLNNGNQRDFSATVRIFMAPTNDETGTPFKSLNEQREFFIEMDKFVVKLRPGENVIDRSSTLSSVSHPVLLTLDEQHHHKKKARCFKSLTCGWPLNLLVPRGTTSGMDFDLFAMVTDWREDRSEEFSYADDVIFDSGVAVCGLENTLSNPDGRPMGFPFDRKFQERSLSGLVGKFYNMIQSKITVYHRG